MTARRHGEQGMALYDREQHRSLAFLYGGHDPGVCCHMHSGVALWLLGYPTAALERSRAGLGLARDLAHPGSLANALPFMSIVQQLRGEVGAIHELAESMIALSTAHGLSQWLAFGRILNAWVQAEQGRGEAATAGLRRAVAEYRAGGNDLWVPCFLALLAAAYLTNGATDEGLGTVADALASADVTGSRLWNPEFYRLKGELLFARDPAAAPDAETAFRQAIDVARGQSAKSWELRAALSLSRLWQRQGQRDEARQLLQEIYGWFTEGFDTTDLKEARALLDELSPGGR